MLEKRNGFWDLHSECPKERVLFGDIIRKHWQRRFERLASTGSGHFELSARGFAHIFGQIRRIKEKVEVRRPRTSLLNSRPAPF